MEKNPDAQIYIEAVIGFIVVQLTHKLVHEIPGAFQLNETMSYVYVALQVLLLITGVILLLTRRDKWSLLPGMLAAGLLLIQPVYRTVRVLLNLPVDDHGAIWWYPIFPIVQGLLILYFSRSAWKRLA